MIRVLFVDDDPDVLDSLRHLLTRQEHEWDMVFAPDPDAGLAELEREAADVVVSDLRMPGIGGAGFLALVRDLYPSAARIVLSGEADPESAQQEIPLAHQYLGKPCRADLLVDVVNRTAGLTPISMTTCCAAWSPASTRLPSVPHLYLEIDQARGARRCHARRDHGRSSSATPRWWRRCCRWGTRRGSAAGAVSRRSVRRCSFSAPTYCAVWRLADTRSGP